MLLTLTTTHRSASDPGFLLNKHPDRVQTFELRFGSAHVCYPELSDARCTAALLLEVDPIGLVRGRSGKRGGDAAGLLTQYMKDRPYAASSFLSAANSRVFGSGLEAQRKTRPELVDVELALTASVAVPDGDPSHERSVGNTSIAAERPAGGRRIGGAAAVVSSFMNLRLLGFSAAVLMLLGCPPSVAAADAVRVLEPLPETPVPEALLPHQIDDPAVATSVRLLAAADGMSQQGPWTHRLCLGDERAAVHVLAGLEEAAANGALEKAEVDWAYREIVRGCPDRGPDQAHARWLLRAARDAKTAGARALLFDALASVHSLDEPELFEQEAPDDALIAFHRRRSGDAANAYSARLAALVERRLADGDERGLRSAAEALARSSDVRAVETFRRLLDRRPPTELAYALWQPLRVSPRADGFALFQSHCAPRLEKSMEEWRASGASMRGSPHRWGDPCSRETFPSPPSSSGSADASSQEDVPAPARCQPLPWYEALPASPASETCFDLSTTRGTQFAGDGQLLRMLVRLVRPHLDAVAIAERWPAVDAVSLERGQIEHTIFVNGDGVLVRVPPDETGAPDAAVAATITRQLEEALDGERWIDVEHDGVRRRFAFGPCGAPWCAQAMLDIANALLEGSRAPVRLTRDTSEPHVLRIRVEGTEHLAR